VHVNTYVEIDLSSTLCSSLVKKNKTKYCNLYTKFVKR